MTTQDIVEMLNTLHAIDPTALQDLIELRVLVSQHLLDSDRVAVVVTENDELGLLGVLNGIAALDHQRIKAVYEDADDGREVLREFVWEELPA